jgi:predicted small secreted protein
MRYSADMPQRRTLMIRNALIALALGALTLTTTACNTVEGVGEDIQSVGRAGKRAID